jgi:hypothetical protein
LTIQGRFVVIHLSAILVLLVAPRANAGEASDGAPDDYACVDAIRTQQPPFDPPRIFDPAGLPVVPDGPILTQPLCPEGTVPISVTELDPMATKGQLSLDGTGAMGPAALDDCDGIYYYGACYYYAGAFYRRNADGGGRSFSVERPSVVTSGG